MEEKHQKTCVTKLMEEAAFTLSKHMAFLTLTMDGLRKKALEKGSVAFSGKHVPIRQPIHIELQGIIFSK